MLHTMSHRIGCNKISKMDIISAFPTCTDFIFKRTKIRSAINHKHEKDEHKCY